MAIHTIRSDIGPGSELGLLDGTTVLVTLGNGQAEHFLPITITRIKVDGVLFPNRVGLFQDDASYLAIYQPAVNPNPARVVFQIGDGPGPNDVTFS